MNYLRPMTATVANGTPWLLAPAEGMGCGVRVESGPVEAAATVQDGVERFALMLQGEATLVTGVGDAIARQGDLIFIPAGATGGIAAGPGARWAAIEAAVEGAASNGRARIISVDQSRFEGQGFAYQSFVDRGVGARSMRMNALRVEPGSGSPDYHIHAFAQIYVIQEGEMTIDIGYARFTAAAGSLVVLPAGVVHRNFNASGAVERHVSLLVPEPDDGAIFDYAVTIHDREAELLSAVPAGRG